MESSSSVSWASPGAGSRGLAVSSPSPVCRSTATVAPSSLSAARPASRTWARAVRAASGWLSSTVEATPAWMLISAMWWPTMSCSSRAIRSRSSATRRRASSSRVCSARRARSSIAATKARRLRTDSPTATVIAVQAKAMPLTLLSHFSGESAMLAMPTESTATPPIARASLRSTTEETV